MEGQARGQTPQGPLSNARKTDQFTGTQPGGADRTGSTPSGSVSPSTADGRTATTPSGTNGQLPSTGNALGKDKAGF